MSHESANVRKSIVFLMVDVYFKIEPSEFSKYSDQFNVNQQKLINIYIERRTNGSSDINLD